MTHLKLVVQSLDSPVRIDSFTVTQKPAVAFNSTSHVPRVGRHKDIALHRNDEVKSCHL